MIRYYALLIVTWDFLMDGLSDHETLALLGVAYLGIAVYGAIMLGCTATDQCWRLR